MRTPIVFLLTSLGLLLPACSGTHASDLAQSGALETDPDVAAYLESKEFAALSPNVADQVRSLFIAAPGASSRQALLGLFRSPKWLMLGSASTVASCPATGNQAQIALLAWLQASAAVQPGESPAGADQRSAANTTLLRNLLKTQDVSNVGAAIAAIRSGLAGQTPAFSLPACDDTPTNDCTSNSSDCTKGSPTTKVKPPAGDGGVTTRVNTRVSTEDCTSNSICPQGRAKPHASLLPQAPAPASLILADAFAAASAQAPSRGLLREWEKLRARYRAIEETTSSRPAADVLRMARRAGSATVRRDERSALKFDQASALVDRFVRSDVAFTPDAMRVVHAVVADKHHGHIRTAGENVQSGDDAARAYLPGAEVEAAVASVFGNVRRSSARGSATPLVAANFDMQLISLHPFLDANGRTSRLMTDWLLLRAGYPPAMPGPAKLRTALFWQRPVLEREVQFDQITSGMRRTVDLLETVLA
jgi:fido (protein-threonine AMPylation protein)